MKISKSIGVEHTVDYNGCTLLVASTAEGCRGCTFEAEGGAIACPHRSSCFADQRPDKISVKFIEVK